MKENDDIKILYDDIMAKTMQAMQPPDDPPVIVGNGEYTHDGRGNIFVIVGNCLGYLARKLKRITAAKAGKATAPES